MKKKLMKMALCALALLPMGAWAEVTNQTWTFTSWSGATITNLSADNTNWAKTTVEGKGDYYQLKSSGAAGSKATLTANSTEIVELSGLKFDYASGTDKVRIDCRTDNRLYFKGSTEKVYVPVSAEKKVSIKYRTASSGTSILMVTSDKRVVAYEQGEASTSERTDNFIVSNYITEDTEVEFHATGSVNISSITVADATPEELAEANEQAYNDFVEAAATTFSGDAVVSTTTLWTFDQYLGGEEVSKGSIVNFNGLYLYGNNDNEMLINRTDKTTINDFGGKSVTYYSILRSKTGRDAAGTKASGINNATIAFNAAVAGTVYVHARVENTSKKMTISFNGTKVVDATITNASAYNTYSYTTNAPGCIAIAGSGAYQICAVKFVPTISPVTTTNNITMNSVGVMTFSDIHAWTLPEGLNAYTVSKTTNGSKLSTTKIASGSTIPACTGVILEGDKNTEYTLTLSDADATTRDINYSLRPVTIDYNLQQTYSTGVDDNKNWDNYILAMSGDDVVLTKTTGTGNIAAGKAYFSIRRDQAKAASANEGTLYIDFSGEDIEENEDNEATGISMATAGSQQVATAYYNLAGQRVAQPTKGLYIVNGKKVIIK